MINSELQNVSKLLEQGQVALQCLSIIEAREYCVQALRLDPSLPEAWLQYGFILEKLGCYQEAIAANSTAQQLYTNPYRTFTPPALEPSFIVAEAMALKRSAPDYWIQQGHALGDLGQYETALAFFDRAIEIDPDHSEAWLGRSNALTALSRYDDAILSYRKMTQLDPHNFQVWNNFGYVWHQIRNYEQAIAHYDQALFHSPSCAPASNNRGFALFHLGLYETAIAAYDYAIALNPNYSAAFHNRGNALRAMGRYREALLDFDRALEISPDFPAAVNSRNLTLDLQRQQNGGQAVQLDSPQQTDPAPQSLEQQDFEQRDLGQEDLNQGQTSEANAGQFPSNVADPGLSNGRSLETVNGRTDQSFALSDLEANGFETFQTAHESLALQEANAEGLAPTQEQDSVTANGQSLDFLESFLSKAPVPLSTKDPATDRQRSVPLNADNQADLDQTNLAELKNKQEEVLAVNAELADADPANPLVRESAKQLAFLQDDSEQLLQQLRYPNLSHNQVNILKRQLAESVQQQVDLWTHTNPLKALEVAEAHRDRCFGRLQQGWAYEPVPLDYSQVQSLLDPHTAILYWHLSHQALTLFLLRHNQPPQIFQPLSERASSETGSRSVRPSQRQALELWLNKWTKDSEGESEFDPLGRDHRPWRDNLEPMLFKRLYKILDVPQICLQLRNVKRLVLIPHRDLCLVPLHALFLDRYTVSYLPSLQAGLQRLSDSPVERPYALLSVENLEERNPVSGRGRVLFARLESALIRTIYGPLWEEPAPPYSTADLSTALNLGSGCLRLTGSRIRDSIEPSRSSIALTGKDRLTIQALSEIDLSRYALVCLSAYSCATTPTQRICDEHIDLTHGLLKAGTASVLSTFWNVKGMSSVLIAAEFHRRLLHDQMPPAKALASTQQWISTLTYTELSSWYQAQADEILAVDAGSLFITRLQELSASAQQKAEEWGEALPYAHPYYWAGFAVVGFNGPQ